MNQDRNNVMSAALSKARNLIHTDSINNIGNASSKAKSIYDLPSDVISSSYVNESIDYEEPSYSYNQENIEYQNSKPTVRNTKLPNEIFESMTKNYIDTKPLSNGMPELGGSILDGLNIQKQQPKKRINEVAQPTIQQVNQNIDYSLIKTIVEDCVKKYSSALKKSILNESKEINENKNGTLQAMKIGDKFSFIDNEGNLYEAKLTFIKNINTNKGGK